VPLTPLDIHNKEFRRTFRGYSEEDVDEFLDEVVRDFEALLRENAQLKERAEELGARLSHYRSMEETMNNTLILAQQTADELRESSRRQADLTVREAESRAAELVRRGEEQLRRLQEKAEGAKDRLQELRARLRGMFAGHMELLDQQIEELDGVKVGGDHAEQEGGTAFTLVNESLEEIDETPAEEHAAAAMASGPPAGPLDVASETGAEAQADMTEAGTEAGTRAPEGAADAAAGDEGPYVEEDEALHG